jgi:hypothetical protein
MLNVTEVSGDQDIVFIAEATKLLIPLKPDETSIRHIRDRGTCLYSFNKHLRTGDVLFYPTIELPPASLDTRENPYSDMLLDRKTDRPGKATMLLAYFTKIREHESSGEIETV